MKTINDLKDEISVQFSTIMTSLSIEEITAVLAFIVNSFSYDFPEVSARVYRTGVDDSQSDATTYNLYLESINDEFLEIKYMLPVQKLTAISKTFYENIYRMDSFYTQIDEVYTIQMTSQYIESMASYYTPRKPMIMSDDTGDFVTLDKDMVIVYTNERVIDPSSIKEYVYATLRTYAYQKFTDFIINRQFSNLMNINQKVFDLIYGAVNTDISTGDLEQVTSVSLSGLSVSFANKLTSYSNALSELSSSFNNPKFLDEMNKTREQYLKKFKRKKNVFYNYYF